MNYMVILAAALLIVAAGVASGDYDDPTILRATKCQSGARLRRRGS